MDDILIIAWHLGAIIIEKHNIWNKELPGNDHYYAMNYNDLKDNIFIRSTSYERYFSFFNFILITIFIFLLIYDFSIIDHVILKLRILFIFVTIVTIISLLLSKKRISELLFYE